MFFFFFKQKTAYEMRISDWSSDVCSSDLDPGYALDTVNAFQAKYEPASRVGTSIATIPLNMAAETRSALARVAREHGDIDEWVAGKLGDRMSVGRDRVCQYV